MRGETISRAEKDKLSAIRTNNISDVDTVRARVDNEGVTVGSVVEKECTLEVEMVSE